MMIKHIIVAFLFFSQGLLYGQFNGVETLKERLDSIINYASKYSSTVSAKVVHADYNKTLYEHQPEAKVIPASIIKLITSACSFMKLGQDYEFKTVIYTDDNILSDEEINGNIYIKGYGDPDLSSLDIEYLANQLIKTNIKKITGNIIVDDSYFDDNYYTLSGQFKGDTGPSYWPYVNALSLDKNKGYLNPALSAGELLSIKLINANIELGGISISGKTPGGAKEIARLTRSIFDVMSHMNKASDNHSAITVFKLLGAKLIGNPGSIKGGMEAIENFLTEIGINRYSYEVLDGSGLTRYNRVTADVIIKLLKYMYDDRLLFDYFFHSLSVAGKDGTLKNRMKGTEAEGNVYAKTGTLSSVSSLSGYVINRDNEILIFYIVMNGFGRDATLMKELQDEFCIVLSEYTRK